MLSFTTLEQKFGTPAALHCLQEIEKAARIRSAEVAALDPDQRLLNAIHAQENHLRQVA